MMNDMTPLDTTIQEIREGKQELNIVIVKNYDLTYSPEAASGTVSFTKEEVSQAKKIVFAELEREGLMKFKPRLLLSDNQNSSKIMVVFAIPADEDMYDGDESRGRTYHIQNGRLLRVIKARPRSAGE